MNTFITGLRSLFIAHANPERAAGQGAYMRHQFVFIGLPTPLRKELQKESFKKDQPTSYNKLIQMMAELWAQEERDFHYAALDLAFIHKKLWTPALLPFLIERAQEQSWWDTIDYIAPRLVGPLVQKFSLLTADVQSLLTHHNFWVRRIALLYQLKYKTGTDQNFLFDACRFCMSEKEFFIRKAIGWALREYSKTDPIAVRAFIEKHRTQLSPLSIREGGKYC